jgi:acetyl esterase/lipase
MRRIYGLIIGMLLLTGCQATQKDIPYGQIGDQKLLLDAREPSGPGPYPVLILVHGGGWSTRSKDHDFDSITGALRDAGFTTFCINYRLAPKNRWPDCLEDLQAAIRWAKANAAQYKGNPNQIGLIGHSSGGHLVCLATTIAGPDTQVQAVVGLAPPTDLVMDCKLRSGGLSKGLQNLTGHPKKLDPKIIKQLEEMSAVDHVHPGLPPFLLIQGTDDHAVPHQEVLELWAKLLDVGDSCEMISVQGGGHEFRNWSKADPTWLRKMIAWLHANVR